jgi:hypothetical protein
LGGTGAEGVFPSAQRPGCYVLENLLDFERHLVRLKASYSGEQSQ